MNWFREDDGKLLWQKNHELLQIEPWENDSLRIRSTLSPRIEERRWALLNPVKITPKIEISDDGATIQNGKIKAKISPTGAVTYLKSADNSILLEETYIRHGGHSYPARHSLSLPTCSGIQSCLSCHPRESGNPVLFRHFS